MWLSAYEGSSLWGRGLSLALSEQVAAKQRDVVLAHMKVLGLILNDKKSVLSPLQRTTYRGVAFDQDAGTYVPCSDRVDPHGSQESEIRPVTHCQAVSETARSDGSCVQHDTYWPVVHETPTVVAQDQGVLPKWKLALHDQGHVAVPTCLRHVEEALVLVYGSRDPVETGADARGIDASPRGAESNLESVWPGSGVPLRYSGDSTMSPLVLSAPLGLDAMVQTWPRLRLYTFSPDHSVPGSSGESALGRGQSTSGSAVLAGPSMVLGPDFSPR